MARHYGLAPDAQLAMLGVAWEALYQAIPRHRAEDRLDAYTVAVLAEGWSVDARDRDRVLQSWRDQTRATVQQARQSLREQFGHLMGWINGSVARGIRGLERED